MLAADATSLEGISLARLIQSVAVGFLEQNGILIVASSRMETNSNGETFLIQPHH